jgi:hypothetical protein
MGSEKWEIADKKAWDELLMRCIREKVHKVKIDQILIDIGYWLLFKYGHDIGGIQI